MILVYLLGLTLTARLTHLYGLLLRKVHGEREGGRERWRER